MRIDAKKTCDWHIPTIGALGFLLWTTNRRRVKPNFDMRGEADIEAMLPTLVGLTEGAVDHGNSVEIVQNGALFDRLIEDIRGAKHSIHIESYIWWTGAVCDRIGNALAQRARKGIEVRLLLDYSGSSRMDSS